MRTVAFIILVLTGETSSGEKKKRAKNMLVLQVILSIWPLEEGIVLGLARFICRVSVEAAVRYFPVEVHVEYANELHCGSTYIIGTLKTFCKACNHFYIGMKTCTEGLV